MLGNSPWKLRARGCRVPFALVGLVPGRPGHRPASGRPGSSASGLIVLLVAAPSTDDSTGVAQVSAGPRDTNSEDDDGAGRTCLTGGSGAGAGALAKVLGLEEAMQIEDTMQTRHPRAARADNR